MSKPVARDVALVMAAYPTVEAASADWKLLHESKIADNAHLYDLAVVEHDAEGRVHVVKNMHHKVRRGLIIGAVAAVITPVGLAAGMAVGAAAGKIASHFHKGVSKQDITGMGELLDRSSVMLIALADADLAGPIRDSIHSTDVLVKSMSTDDAEFTRLIGDYDNYK